MHILIRVAAAAVVLAVGISCTPQGAMTPRDAFFSVRIAFEKGDPDVLERVLSEQSIARVRRICALFAGMNDRQLAEIAATYGVEPAVLKDLSLRGYLELFLSREKRGGSIARSLKARIVSTHKEERKATVFLENGMEFDFVKEGPYWKFDMTGF